MIAKVSSADGRFLGIHRTYLANNGREKAPVEPNKMMLGSCGGGSVHLAKAGPVLMVGEGIETCLSAMQATGLPAWAALSAGHMTKLALPDCVREVIVLADGDPAGRKAADQAAARWRRAGLTVRIFNPGDGKDINDLLQEEAQ